MRAAAVGQSTADVEHGQFALATVECLSRTEQSLKLPTRRLRHGVELHVASEGRSASSVAGLPPVLKQGSYYIPARHGDTAICNRSDDEEAQIVIGVNAPTRLYLLWPALQDLPSWVGHEFELVRGSEVKVRWSDFTRQQRFYLNVTNQRRLYYEQVLLVFRLRGNHGYLLPGEDIQLPYTATRRDVETEQPFFSHVICLRPAREVSASGAGDAVNKQSSFTSARPLNSYSLPEICMALEDGVFSPAELGRRDANELLRRSIAVGDDELLFMLVDGGVGACCCQPTLQLLLQYARYEDLPQLAVATLQHSAVELTKPVLDWLVRHKYKNIHEAEAVLAGYCMTRRNPLSSLAAVEQSIYMVAESRLVINQEALKLALKFKAAKLALLQKLMQQYDTDHIEQMQFSNSGMPSGHSYLMHEITASGNSDTPPVLQVRPLQQAIRRCMQKTSTYMLGSGGSTAPVSIHDASPYSIAISMEDTDFLQHPAVVEYTRRLWRGSELHKMAQIWQKTVAHTRPMGSSANWGLITRKGPGRRVTAARVAVAASGTSMYSLGEQSTMVNKSASPLTARQQIILPGAVEEAAAADCRAVVQIQALGTAGTGSATSAAAGLTSTSDSIAADSRPMSSAKLPQSPTPGPCAEAVEDDPDAPNNSTLSSSSRVAPSPATAGGVVRRRTTHECGSVNNDSLENKDAAQCGKGMQGVAWLDPDIGMELLQNCGLAGGVGQPIARAAMRLLHGVLLTPRALHNTARFRWMKRCMVEMLFTIMYMGLSMGFLPTNVVLCTLAPLILGNFVNIVFEVRWLNGGSFMTYLRSNWGKLDVAVNVGLFVALIWEFRLYIEGNKMLEGVAFEHYGVKLEHVVPSIFSILVWARALGVFTPANERMAALLYTLKKGAQEAAVMIPLVLTLICGFASTLYVVYRKMYPEYSTMLGALRMMAVLTLGGHHLLLEFEHQESHLDPFLVSWGQIVIILYGVIFNILIMTLLVAVITKTYNPESVKAKAVLMGAEAVGHYDWRVRHSFAVTPVNLFQVLLAWLPQGYRSRVPTTKYFKYCIPPLDGYVPKEIVAAPAMLLPTGPAELGYLSLLLVAYPMVSCMAIVLLVLHIPFGVMHYAVRGHLLWIESTWNGSSNKLTREKKNPASAAAAAAGGDRLNMSVDGAGVAGGQRWSISSEPHHEGSWFGGSVPPSPGACNHKQQQLGSHRPFMPGMRSSLAKTAAFMNLVVTSSGRAQYQPSSQVRHKSRCSLTCGLIATCKKFAGNFLQIAFAVVFGLVAHLVLLAVITAAIVLALVSRVVFSLMCIFMPSVADCSCCLQPTRYADFWSQSTLLAAFETADLHPDASSLPGQGSRAAASAGTLKGHVLSFDNVTGAATTRPVRFSTADDVVQQSGQSKTGPDSTLQPVAAAVPAPVGFTPLQPTLSNLMAEVDSWMASSPKTPSVLSCGM